MLEPGTGEAGNFPFPGSFPAETQQRPDIEPGTGKIDLSRLKAKRGAAGNRERVPPLRGEGRVFPAPPVGHRGAKVRV